MQYTQELFDRRTGEMTSVDIGDWITVTEFGKLQNMGARQTRTVLRHLDFLQIEGGGKHNRHRLASWVVEKGWGKRIERRHAVPFDVIGPEGRLWLEERWQEAVASVEQARSAPACQAKSALEQFRYERNAYRRSHGNPEMDVVEMTHWLVDHFPKLSHSEIASVLDVSQQLVSRYLKERERKLRQLWTSRRAEVPVKPKAHTLTPMDRL